MTQNSDRQIEPSSSSKISLPPWPTSKPGPKVTDPPPGMKRSNRRTEQVIEVNYNQETGKSGVRSDSR